MKNHTQKLIFTGLLITIGIVLSQFVSLPFPPSQTIIKVGIGYLPLILISLLFGPIIGLFSGVTQDIIGYFIWGAQTGPFHFGFVFNAILFGVLPGLMFRHLVFKDKTYKIINLVTTGILFIASLVLLFNIDFLTENPQIINRFEGFTSGLAYTLVFTSAISILAMLLFIIFRKQKDHNHQLIFIVTILLLITSVFLTPLWVSDLYNIPYLYQLPLRILKLPFEAIIYSILIVRLHSLIMELQENR